ncbi:CDP-alcohol phosphatidyltransferase family protein [Flavobacteriaceae bacterium TK19130]|nr:CDP-alcohol phosphatidyltransferase family protein [Thermobacterium salinum]
MQKHIPNLITSLNLLCGSVAVMLAVVGEVVPAAFFVFAGIFFDFFDGLAARLLKAQSPVGLQLDSLADVITSGLAPAVVMVQLFSQALSGDYLDVTAPFASDTWNAGYGQYAPFVGLLIAVASAYRLAKFNVDERQVEGFIGLPTPANAILILSIPLILEYQSFDGLEGVLLNPWFLLLLTIFSSILLNAEIELFALKFKDWGLKKNGFRYAFLVLCIVAILLLKFIAIPVIIALYIGMSLFLKQRKV